MTDDEKEKANRFSDEALREFYLEFHNHINQEEDAMSKFIECHKTTQADIKQLSEDTREMREAWHAAEGAVKVGALLGKFVKWLSGIAIVGWVFVELVKHADKVK